MKRILVVDDDTDFRESLVHILVRKGFDVNQADSGVTARSLVGENEYDVALLDLMMPEMDGIETMMMLKKIRPNLRFIMITAFATIDNAVLAVKKGAHDYIAKPFQTDNLIVTIHRVLEEAKFEEEIRINDLDQALVALSNPIRRQIVSHLSLGESLRLSEIAKALKIKDHSKVLFHLKILKEVGILTQMENRTYYLNQPGRNLMKGLKDLKKRMVDGSEDETDD